MIIFSQIKSTSLLNIHLFIAMSLVFSIGCYEQDGGMGVGPKSKVIFKSTTHKKWKWKAEYYFKDSKVIKLCKAIEANDLDEMERLIKAGADVNAVGWAGMTPLLWAFPDNKIERFKLLLENGANPDVLIDLPFDPQGFFNPARPDEKQWGLFNSGGEIRPGWSVTHLAAKSKYPDYFKEILKQGCDLELEHEELAIDIYISGSLMYSFFNDSGMTEKEARDSMLETIEESSHDSLLHVVIKAGVSDKVERIQMLIDAGADLNHLGGDSTPAATAVRWGGQYHIALMLLEAGANPTIYGKKSTKRLVHVIVGEKEKNRNWTKEPKVDYQNIVNILVAHGESLEEAKKDLDRWSGWVRSLPPAEYGKRRKKEADKRRLREKAK